MAQQVALFLELKLLPVWSLTGSPVFVGFFWFLRFPPTSQKHVRVGKLATLNYPYTLRNKVIKLGFFLSLA